MGRRRQQRLAEEAAEQAARKGVRLGIRRILTRIARRILRLEVEGVAEAIERGESGVEFAERASQGSWVRRWADNLGPVLEEAVVEVSERKLPKGDPLPPNMRRWLDQYTSQLADTLSTTSYENVRKAIEDGQAEGLGVRDVAQRLREREPEFSKYRSELIARTELHRSSIGASYYQALESGLVGSKIWRTARDSRVRDEHEALEGTAMGISEAFPNGLLFPQEPNCRCYLEFALEA